MATYLVVSGFLEESYTYLPHQFSYLLCESSPKHRLKLLEIVKFLRNLIKNFQCLHLAIPLPPPVAHAHSIPFKYELNHTYSIRILCSGRLGGCDEEGKYNSLQESHLQQGKWPFFLVRYTYLPHQFSYLLCESASQAVLWKVGGRTQ